MPAGLEPVRQHRRRPAGAEWTYLRIVVEHLTRPGAARCRGDTERYTAYTSQDGAHLGARRRLDPQPRKDARIGVVAMGSNPPPTAFSPRTSITSTPRPSEAVHDERTRVPTDLGVNPALMPTARDDTATSASTAVLS